MKLAAVEVHSLTLSFPCFFKNVTGSHAQNTQGHQKRRFKRPERYPGTFELQGLKFVGKFGGILLKRWCSASSNWIPMKQYGTAAVWCKAFSKGNKCKSVRICFRNWLILAVSIHEFRFFWFLVSSVTYNFDFMGASVLPMNCVHRTTQYFFFLNATKLFDDSCWRTPTISVYVKVFCSNLRCFVYTHTGPGKL